jgi:hypothetical protein
VFLKIGARVGRNLEWGRGLPVKKVFEGFAFPLAFVVALGVAAVVLAASGLAADGADSDGDGVSDSTDSCPLVFNPDGQFSGVVAQKDWDGDGVANACDSTPGVPADRSDLRVYLRAADGSRVAQGAAIKVTYHRRDGTSLVSGSTGSWTTGWVSSLTDALRAGSSFNVSADVEVTGLPSGCTSVTPQVITVVFDQPGTWAHYDFVLGGDACGLGITLPAATTATTTASTTTAAATTTAATTTAVTTTTTTPTVTTSTTATTTQAMPAPARRCSVPAVVGKTLSAARRVLHAASCGVGTVKQAYSARVKKGSVVSQTPAGGAERKSGFAVSLVVSRGPKPT